ncbi:carboxylesterase [Actinoplanes lutulentus]|uniref:Carboxylesterase n=1 Tax=Actinoplanes lutulentus TaxID=1287878 RepID=A0A327ZJR1_9ACTN|nr:alpha/beta fold hydrolase [Actinoplanes lutulentus]MBB2940592.1 carboxylesterase [Actinoplanes lutulentus]RAK42903.1 carboxylesterase [Actinoplanes lutulentus]
MNDPTPVLAHRPRHAVRTVIVSLAAVTVLLVAVLYTWPVTSGLRQAAVRPLSYASAQAEALRTAEADANDQQVRPGCASQILDHGERTGKAVLMLHGYTACPSQLSGLAKEYFDAGYNVYIPRAPLHGITDRQAHAEVEAGGLIRYAADAWNIAAALGDDVGIVGISGGAVLATWLAQYRADSVRRLLVLSPFYRPDNDKAPSIAIRPMTFLYSNGLLPDHVNANGYSFTALAQYMRVAAAFQQPPEDAALSSVALVVSPNDTFIDHDQAVTVPRELAEDSGASFAERTLPKELGLEHDIVTVDRLGPAADDLYPMYRELYEAAPAG